MPANREADITVRINLEGHWPRATYRRLCAERGVAYDEQDYLRWRAVGERLTGEPCFETVVDRAAKAFAQLGVAAAKAGEHLQKAFNKQ